jgi:RNA polymerase sigma-70 factor (ECF subfamily)
VKHSSFDDFEQLVRENQRVVYQIAFSVLGNAADTEDVTQDAFVRAYGKLASLRDPERFRAWVCRIVRRLALNRVRAETRMRHREDVAASGTAGTVDVEALAADREFEARTRREIDRLPPKLRDVLLLCAVEGLEPNAVATLLGIPPGTVRSRLHLARKALLRTLSS